MDARLVLVLVAATGVGVAGVRSGLHDARPKVTYRIGQMQDSKESLLSSPRLETCVSEGSVFGWSETRVLRCAEGK